MRKGFCACLSHRVLLGPRDQPADAAHRLGLLGATCEWPCRHPPDERCNETAPPHSMTSSARARIAGGTVRPSALAVLRLTTSSNVVGCWTGRSAGLAPLRIFSDVDADLAMDRRKAGAIADQTASLGVYAPRINRRNRLAYGQCYQLLVMAFEKGISLDDQPVGAQFGEGSEGGADLAFAACLQDRERHRLYTGRLLHVPDCRSGLRKTWVNQQGDHLGPGEQVAEQLEPLGDELLVENGEPREIAAWPRKTGDQPSRNRVLADDRNARDRRGRFFRREGGGCSAVGRDHIDLAAAELRREAGQTIVMVLSPPVFD